MVKPYTAWCLQNYLEHNRKRQDEDIYNQAKKLQLESKLAHGRRSTEFMSKAFQNRQPKKGDGGFGPNGW